MSRTSIYCFCPERTNGSWPSQINSRTLHTVLPRYRAVADVIYNPHKTMLLKEAEAAGCKVATGFDMFVYQGVEQFEMWTGKEAPVQAMKTVVFDRLMNR